MRSSWQVGIVILTLVGLSGCAGVQQRGRSSSPMQGLSVDVPGRPGWPTRLFRWRLASAEPRVETTRRAVKAPGPETDIWPDRGRSVLSRLLTAFPTSRSNAAGAGAGAGSSFLSRRESSPSSGELTVAEANAAIARAARPRPAPASIPATRDASVLTTRGEAPADDPAEAPEPEAPPLLETPIPLPGGDAAERASEAAATAPAIEPDAILTQAPPPPPLRPTPRPAEPRPEPKPEPEPTETAPPAEPVKPVEPKPEPAPAEVVQPAEPALEPVKPAEPSEPSRTVKTDAGPAIEAPEPSAAPSPFQESTSPFAASQTPPSAPVAAAPQVYFDSPGPSTGAPAPLRPHEDAPPRWSFWSWKDTSSRGGEYPIETSAQLPAVQFPASYGVTPTAQGPVALPSPQVIATAPVEKCWRLKALGARLHDKLERLRAWKHEHICKHIQNFKAALKGHKCLDCGGDAESFVQPLASPQSAPSVLATSQFGLY